MTNLITDYVSDTTYINIINIEINTVILSIIWYWQLKILTDFCQYLLLFLAVRH